MFKNTEVIYGAPGCGKTTAIRKEVENLLKTYRPDEIALVTFTRAGADELRKKIVASFPDLKKEDFPYVRTIHSLCFSLLDIDHGSLINKRDYREFSKAVNKRFMGYYTEELKNNDDKYLFLLSLEANNKEAFDRLIGGDPFINYQEYLYIKKSFAAYKEEMSVNTFDDMLTDCLKEKVICPVKVAVIDEAQDLTTLQWAVCESLFRDAERVIIAGDDDQSIYEWMGADVKKFLSYGESAKVRILDKSYRLKSDILSLAKTITGNISQRVDKVFSPVAIGGNIHWLNSVRDIPEINTKESYYFLARNNCYLKNFREILESRGLPYVDKKGNASVNGRLIDCIIAFNKMSREGKSMEEIKCFSATMANHTRDRFNPRDPWYDAFDMSFEEVTYYRDIVRVKPDLSKISQLKISTIHGVKGGEADNVFIMLDVTRTVYDNLMKNPDSELRCLYVAATRAKTNLYFIRSGSRYGFDDYIEEENK